MIKLNETSIEEYSRKVRRDIWNKSLIHVKHTVNLYVNNTVHSRIYRIVDDEIWNGIAAYICSQCYTNKS